MPETLSEEQLKLMVWHAETAWALTGQHTGRTDFPLTTRGERNARSLAQRLSGVVFAMVLTSPLSRALRICELAGFGGQVEIDADLQEWDYGQYEGLRNMDIRRERPGWDLFRDGCPGGESVEEVTTCADRVLARLRGRARSCSSATATFSVSWPRAGWACLPGQHAIFSSPRQR
jgi:probable phosphoglycerate mutase